MNDSSDLGGLRLSTVFEDDAEDSVTGFEADEPLPAWSTQTINLTPDEKSRSWIDPDRSLVFWVVNALAVVVAVVIVLTVLFSVLPSNDGEGSPGSATSIPSTLTEDGGSAVSTDDSVPSVDAPASNARTATTSETSRSIVGSPPSLPTREPTISSSSPSPTSDTTTVPSTVTAVTAVSATGVPPTDPPTTYAPTPTDAPTPAPVGDAGVQQQVLDLTNQERAAQGCPALSLNPRLNSAADAHSEDMVARGFFSHRSPEGQVAGDRIRAAGYSPLGWGENIARGHATASAAVNSWTGNPEDMSLIANCSYTELGVGYASSGGTAAGGYWTQVFSAQ